MRKGLVVVGLTAIVVGSIGYLRLMDEALPEPAGAGTPRAVSPTGHDTAAETSPPSVPAANAAPGGLLETQRLLRRHDFEALRRLVEAKQARLEQDVRWEDELGQAVAAFDVADPALTPLLDAWVVAQPDAWAPRLARARHRLAVAWERRGSKWAKDTSEEQVAGMRESLDEAIGDAREALRHNPKLTEAYRTLIKAAMGRGDPQACVRLAELGLAVAPASLRVRSALALCLLPRWGGSYDAVAALAREAQQYAGQNPALAALLGFVDWDRGCLARNDKKYDEAAALFTRALAAGEHAYFYYDRADTYLRQKRYTEALADVARLLAMAPEDPGVLLTRAWILVGLERYQDALADVQVMSEFDPTSDRLARFRQQQAETALSQAYQLLEMTKDVEGAIARYTWAIQMSPANAEALYWRGRAYIRKDDRVHALADFEAAIRLDPRHFESYRNVDWLLAQRGDWDGVIAHWTRYIDLEPLNSQAYLERGGAYHRKGDQRAALADADKACGLGAPRACELIGRGSATR